MNRLRSRILIPFSKSVVLSKIVHLLFTIALVSHLSIYIALHCVSTIAYTSVVCYTSTYTFVDGYTYGSMVFSSPTSIYVIYVSTKCCSIAFPFFDSLMNTRSTSVAPSPICFLTYQHLMFLRKNSTTNVLIAFIS
jgi:hypothetical protein